MSCTRTSSGTGAASPSGVTATSGSGTVTAAPAAGDEELYFALRAAGASAEDAETCLAQTGRAPAAPVT